MDETALKRLATTVLKIEAQAILDLCERIDHHFVRACELMLACQGRVVVLGMGKSGHIGGKIAATLASTGTPAFFVHPGEASHGDLGMITAKDVVLALSNSGETAEIVTLLPLLKRLQIPFVSFTGNPHSTLAKAATANIHVGVAQEACPLGLAPTSSSTATLAMGDALAIALLEKRGFTAEDFARTHPGGSLGRRLLLLVDDVMHQGEEIPQVNAHVSLGQALLEMSRKGMGMTAIVDEQRQVLGIYTDGDLRRCFDTGIDIHQTSITAVMTKNCKTIGTGILAAEALALMQEKKITALLIVNQQQQLIGALHMHDLLRAGVV